MVTLLHQETSCTVSGLTSGLALGIAAWVPTAAPDLGLQMVPKLHPLKPAQLPHAATAG